MLCAGLTGEAAHHQRGRRHRFSRVAVRLSFSTPGILPCSRREKVSAQRTLSCAPQKQRPENAKASPTRPLRSTNRQERLKEEPPFWCFFVFSPFFFFLAGGLSLRHLFPVRCVCRQDGSLRSPSLVKQPAGLLLMGFRSEAVTRFPPPVPFYENESNPDLRLQGRDLGGQMKGAEGGKGTKEKGQKVDECKGDISSF